MYLPILHLPKVELRCKLQEKLHHVTGPLEHLGTVVSLEISFNNYVWINNCLGF